MRLPVRCLSIAACLAGLSGVVMAEQVDNPAYASWAKYKPGTTVTYKQSMDMAAMPAGMPAGMQMPQTTITEKLKEVKPEAVTLEVSSTTQVMGQTHTSPVREMTIPAKTDKDKAEMPSSMKGEVSDVKTGKDKVDVNGKSVDATTTEMTVAATEPHPMTAHVKVWRAEDVPGGMVKVVTDMQSPMKGTSTMSLDSFNIVK